MKEGSGQGFAGLVHKRTPGGCLIVDAERVSADVFGLIARWPAPAGAACPVVWLVPDAQGVGSQMLLFAAESVRQAAMLVSHRFYDVPLDWPFVMSDLSVELLGAGALEQYAAAGKAGRECHVAVEAVCSQHRLRRSTLRGMRVVMNLRDCAGTLVARGEGGLTVLDPNEYAALRGAPELVTATERECQVAAAAVGVRGDGDVRVGMSRDGLGEGLRLAICVSDLDHPSDHVPGMVLIEAALQGHRLWSRGSEAPSVMEAEFRRFVDFAPAVRLGVATEGGDWAMSFVQRDQVAARVRLR